MLQVNSGGIDTLSGVKLRPAQLKFNKVSYFKYKSFEEINVGVAESKFMNTTNIGPTHSKVQRVNAQRSPKESVNEERVHKNTDNSSKESSGKISKNISDTRQIPTATRRATSPEYRAR